LQWTAQGILYSPVRALSSGDILFRTVAGQDVVIDDSQSASTSGAISPDGAFVAYSSEETGRSELYVRQFPDGARWRVSRSGGLHPRWTADGSSLFYLSGNRVMRVGVTLEEGGFRSGPPELVARLPMPGNFISKLYDVTDDGKTIALVEFEPPGEPVLLFMTGLRGRLAD